MVDSLDLRDLAEEYYDLKERAEDSDQINPLDEDEQERLADLKDLESQLFTDTMAEYADNEPTMIPTEDFEDYAQDFASEVGYLPLNSDNPLFNCIDWEAWASDMLYDYTEVTFEGREYLIRVY